MSASLHKDDTVIDILKGDDHMSEKKLEKVNPCGDGKVIDDYLEGTICEMPEEVKDVLVSEDGEYVVHEPEEPEADDSYKDFLGADQAK